MALATLGPRRCSPFERALDPELLSRKELVDTFLDVELGEASALLVVIAGLSGDEMLRWPVRREITVRGHALPAWLAELHQARPVPGGRGWCTCLATATTSSPERGCLAGTSSPPWSTSTTTWTRS